MTDLFDRRLRDAARAIPTPDEPDDLIERVLAERGTGRRIVLPTDLGDTGPSRARQFVRPAIISIAAAVAAIAMLFVLQPRPRASLTANDTISSTGGFLVSTAFAEQRSRSPTVPRLSGVDGARIVPRQYEYRIQFVDSAGGVTPDGGGSLTVSAATVGGTPAWRIALTVQQTEGGGQRRTTAETLFVSRGDLEPLARAVHVRPYLRFNAINIAQRFVGDSVLGEMTTDGGIRRPIAQRLPAEFGPFIADVIAPLALVGVPLSLDWSRSMSVPGWAVVPTDVFYPVTLRVIGEERITTPAGAFDCWKLSVVAGRQRRVEWVRKSDGLALRSYDEAATPRGRRQYDLLNP
jgi:hypothetical protein